MATMNRNIPLSIDDELLAEIDRVAETTKESRSAVMRRAIREGLPVIKSGGGADVVTLDSETSRHIDEGCKLTNVSRSKFLIEAIRKGTEATYSMLMRDKLVRAQDQNPNDKETETLIHSWEHSMVMDDPMVREVRTAMRQRGAIMIRLCDLLQYVPEAWRRHELIEQLLKSRRGPGGFGGGVWGCGLSTREIEWQVQMAEKYGAGAKPPDEEIAAREAEREREREDRTHSEAVGESVRKVYPLDWKP
jgi:metal-responsive CopG/Arc/MetJ family transcriptional regulator